MERGPPLVGDIDASLLLWSAFDRARRRIRGSSRFAGGDIFTYSLRYSNITVSCVTVVWTLAHCNRHFFLVASTVTVQIWVAAPDCIQGEVPAPAETTAAGKPAMLPHPVTMMLKQG